MALKVGAADVTDVKLGATQVAKVMLGAEQVWPVAPKTVTVFTAQWNGSAHTNAARDPGYFAFRDRNDGIIANMEDRDGDATAGDQVIAAAQTTGAMLTVSTPQEGILVDHMPIIEAVTVSHNRFEVHVGAKYSHNLDNQIVTVAIDVPAP